MPIVAIENIGDVGIVNDTPPHELPPEAWSAGQNMRFLNGKAQKIMGETSVFGTPTIAPHWLLPWQAQTNYYWIYAGVDKVYYTEGSVHTNITRYTTTPGDDDYSTGSRPLWTGGILHGVPILNNNNFVDPPQQWDSALSRLKDLDNWPASTWCNVMRPFQNFLVALHIKKGATEYPYTVKWSHPADPGSVPVTWDETDVTKLAGEQTIAQTGGHLVDCLPLNGINIVYKEDAIWTMTLAGSQYVFAFREASNSVGLLAPKCVKEFYRRHLVVGQNDIVVFDGLTPQSIVTKRMRDFFYNNLDSTHWDKTTVTINYAHREVWISYVEAGSTYLTHALVWNWDTNIWTVKELPDLAHLAYGVVNVVSESFDTSSGTFDSDFGPFGSPTNSPAEAQMLYAKASGTAALVQGDQGYTGLTANYTSYLERTGLPIAGQDRQGQPKLDPASVKLIRAVFPKISAPIPVTLRISIGVQDTPEGTITWEGPYDFVVGTDVKVDCSLSGKYVAFRIEDLDNGTPWEFTGYSVDLDVISRL